MPRRRVVFGPAEGTGGVAAGLCFVRAALAAWRLPGAGRFDGDAVLVAAELLANAAVHAGGARRLILERRPRTLLIEVADDSPRRPETRLPHRPDIAGGHGLHIVDVLSEHWGVTPCPDGKTVWAELRLPGPAP
ncbi:ATP-binding protein [Kitasatospora sp. NPDC059571]|uniref:ATP-binding protein n=1 Tax=Kitasatospora sp. NPDC059571 TaxID=3346871 RepID=UPI00369EB913